MKYFLLFLVLTTAEIGLIHSQVYQIDSYEINKILEDEINGSDQKPKKQTRKVEEELFIEQKETNSITTPTTKTYIIIQDKIAEIQTGRVTLPDGSKWIINSKDVAKTLLWKVNNNIQIRLEKDVDPIKDFSTIFINLDRKDQINVMLEVLPLTLSSISQFLKNDPQKSIKDIHSIAINIHSGSIIELHNGAKFNISPLDMILTRYWKTNQPLKIYHQKHMAHPFILLNEHTKEKVAANLIKPPTPPFKLLVEEVAEASVEKSSN